MSKNAQWSSIGEAAKYLGVSRDTLRRWEKSGKIKTLRSPTNRRYYTRALLDEVMSGKKPKSSGSKNYGPRKNLIKLILIGLLSFVLAVILAFVFLYFL
jgi:excisionase family DNA binding protein